MTTVRTNGIEIYYEVHGAGEPLLLIMGLGANASNWEMQIETFAREYQVIAFDNRGAGRSEKPAEAYSIHQMAEDAASLLQELGIHSANVFGMSMGGMIAQELALRHANRVRTLVLGATMAGGPGATLPNPAMMQQWLSLARLPKEQAIEGGLKFLYSEDYVTQNKADLVAGALARWELMAPPHALQKQVIAVISFNTQSQLKDIHQPTLILHGTDDKIIPFPNSEILVNGIPGAHRVVYPGMGHGLLVERDDDVNREVLDFLRPHRTHFVAAK
jgi:pimeloyl-ACP methyl ester carboxylesterase